MAPKVQLSVDALFTCAAVTEALPPFRVAVTFRQIAVGAVTSFTLTVAEQVAELLFASVTVSVTELVPTLEQVNEVVFSERVRLLPAVQLSVDALFTCEAVTVTLVPLSETVGF